MKYKAIVVRELSDGNFTHSIEYQKVESFLPAGEVLVRVQYSSLNYKDALSFTGNKGVTKSYPHTPGIDAAGIIEQTSSSLFTIGQEVIVTGFDLGMNTPGGMGELIRVPAEWVVALPEGLSLKEAMIIGTAGFTAAISVQKLVAICDLKSGPVVVSGATGGVGSMAVAMLAKLGYEVHAISGKASEHEFLKSLGASVIYSRDEFQQVQTKPLLPSCFAGAIDTVGGEILVNIIKSVRQDGAITTCGSVSSITLNLNVFPFILRAVSLLGISAQNYPAAMRPALWELLASDFKPDGLMKMYNELPLDEVPLAVEKILKGQLKGRTVIKVS